MDERSLWLRSSFLVKIQNHTVAAILLAGTPDRARAGNFVRSFNNAWEEYRESANRPEDNSHEEVAYRTAWNAVKKKYARDKRTGKWIKKE